ncbi:hypothetical protein KIPB_014826, partial [Kipferlia bialata]
GAVAVCAALHTLRQTEAGVPWLQSLILWGPEMSSPLPPSGPIHAMLSCPDTGAQATQDVPVRIMGLDSVDVAPFQAVWPQAQVQTVSFPDMFTGEPLTAPEL